MHVIVKTGPGKLSVDLDGTRPDLEESCHDLHGTGESRAEETAESSCVRLFGTVA